MLNLNWIFPNFAGNLEFLRQTIDMVFDYIFWLYAQQNWTTPVFTKTLEFPYQDGAWKYFRMYAQSKLDPDFAKNLEFLHWTLDNCLKNEEILGFMLNPTTPRRTIKGAFDLLVYL